MTTTKKKKRKRRGEMGGDVEAEEGRETNTEEEGDFAATKRTCCSSSERGRRRPSSGSSPSGKKRKQKEKKYSCTLSMEQKEEMDSVNTIRQKAVTYLGRKLEKAYGQWTAVTISMAGEGPQMRLASPSLPVTEQKEEEGDESPTKRRAQVHASFWETQVWCMYPFGEWCEDRKCWGNAQDVRSWYERKVCELGLNVERNPRLLALPWHLVPCLPVFQLRYGTEEWKRECRLWCQELEENERRRKREEASLPEKVTTEEEGGAYRKWCRSCGAHTMRFCGQLQTRRGDEGMTTFYMCENCGGRRRE